jgi:DNA invertase Pin-like site-specific DNA recombinase
MIVGYARVSTDGQTLDAQQATLRLAGAEKVYSEKISGAVTDRSALAKAIAALGNGDTLIATKLDRLARSTRDLLNTLAAVGEAGASFKSLGDSWADTTTPHGRLMLTVLGGLAEFERHLILARTSEGNRVASSDIDQRLARSPSRKCLLLLVRSELGPSANFTPRCWARCLEARSGVSSENVRAYWATEWSPYVY